MRTLELLGIQPAAIHMNEGHPALALLERIRQLVRAGQDFSSAAQHVRGTTIFTTHTPVAAGTDVFPYQLMEKYLSPYYDELGLTHDAFMALGANPDDPGAGFNMTVFSLRMASHRNAVSRRHGEVARAMWHSLWPETPAERVPIAAITNGVHLGSWVDPFYLQPLFARYLGADWATQQDRPETWKAIASIPDEELWHIHRHLKASLLAEVDDRVRQRWQRDKVSASSVVGLGALLNPQVLTLGFARRFTGYKRPGLIFHDLERIKRLLTNPWHPVQIIFAGKAHPADVEGKRLIQTIFQWAQDPSFGGRIAFVEDYDQELAEHLVRGVDVWLNNPLPPLEASGTSGMKAAVNGVPNLSILDGWWLEGYNRTASDAEALYRLLEQQIVPLYYERSDDDVPHDFVHVMKAAIQSVAPAFGAQRMLKAYLSQCYTPALAQSPAAISPDA
jgi:starch phosphorylase